MLNQNKDFGF